MLLRHLDRVLTSEEVGRVQHVDVQGMALHPLAAVEQAPQLGDRAPDLHAERILHRRAGAHLVRHRADAADARRQVGRLGGPPAAQEGLEEARGSKMCNSTSSTRPSRTSTRKEPSPSTRARPWTETVRRPPARHVASRVAAPPPRARRVTA